MRLNDTEFPKGLVFVLVTGIAMTGVVLLALINPSSLWSGLLGLMSLLTLGGLLLWGFLLERGAMKCSTLTAACFGIAYLLIVFSGPVLFPVWERLPTSKFLAHLYGVMHGQVPDVSSDPLGYSSGNPRGRDGSIASWPTGEDLSFTNRQSMQQKYIAFAKVGHLCFTMLFVIVGAIIGGIWSGEPRGQAPTAPPVRH